MKNLLFVVMAVFVAYFLFFSEEKYELKSSDYGENSTFVHSSHGYSVELPSKYYQPEEDCPLRTNNLALSTYFRAEGDSSMIFVVGEIEGQFRDHMSENLNLLESNQIDEDQFLKKVANKRAKNKLVSVDGAMVFSSTTVRNNFSSTMVMFKVDSTLVGFMIAHSARQAKEIQEIVESIAVI